jgi:hypothetical protein
MLCVPVAKLAGITFSPVRGLHSETIEGTASKQN